MAKPIIVELTPEIQRAIEPGTMVPIHECESDTQLKLWKFTAWFEFWTILSLIATLMLYSEDSFAQNWGTQPPASAMITDSHGQIWIVTEGPRSVGSPLSSFHVQRGAGTREPLPPIITPRSVQPLGGGYYQPNPYQAPALPQYNPLTGRIE